MYAYWINVCIFLRSIFGVQIKISFAIILLRWTASHVWNWPRLAHTKLLKEITRRAVIKGRLQLRYAIISTQKTTLFIEQSITDSDEYFSCENSLVFILLLSSMLLFDRMWPALSIKCNFDFDEV